MFTLKGLRLTGYIEGWSLLLLIGIAMPVKYMLGEPMLVRVLGSIHGVLFMWYAIVLGLTAKRESLPWWAFPLGFIGSILPFGPFAFEKLLEKSRESKL